MSGGSFVSCNVSVCKSHAASTTTIWYCALLCVVALLCKRLIESSMLTPCDYVPSGIT